MFLDVSFHADLRAFIHTSNLFRLDYVISRITFYQVWRENSNATEKRLRWEWLDNCLLGFWSLFQIQAIITLYSRACHQIIDWFLCLCTDSDHRHWIRHHQRMIDHECLSSYRFWQSSMSIALLQSKSWKKIYKCSSRQGLEHEDWDLAWTMQLFQWNCESVGWCQIAHLFQCSSYFVINNDFSNILEFNRLFMTHTEFLCCCLTTDIQISTIQWKWEVVDG